MSGWDYGGAGEDTGVRGEIEKWRRQIYKKSLK